MFNNIISFFQNLTSEQVALISILVTVLIYFLGKENEIRFKKHELKKEKYMQFLVMLKETYMEGNTLKLTKNWKKQFFDFGSTIFIYGSKKMYKKYCFFREISSDIVKNCKYYNSEIVLFLVADMLNQIRREIGMYNFEFSLNFKSIAFFTNGIYFDPNINFKWWKNKLKVILVKLELFLYKFEEASLIKTLIEAILFPIRVILVIFKCLCVIPLGKLLIKLGIRSSET